MSISLSDIVSKYSHAHLATQDDNAAILAFLKTVDMETTGLNLRYDRAPDFFSFVRQQGDLGFTFLFLNDDGSIGGLCVASFRQFFVKNRLTRAGYLSDLRLHPKLSRRARIQWRQLYADVVEHAHRIAEFDGCEYLYTAILAENETAIKALSNGKSGFNYRELMRYESFAVLGRLPLGPLRRLIPSLSPGEFRVRRATAEDEPRLRSLLHAQNSSSILGDHVTADGANDELARRLSNWKGLSLESFLLAENREGLLVACVAPWTHRESRRLVVDSIGFAQSLLGEILPFLGGKRIRARQDFSVLNFTHLTFANSLSNRQTQQVFHALLSTTYKLGLCKNYHALCIPHLPSRNLAPGMRLGYLFYRTPGIFYQVVSARTEEVGPLLPQGIDSEYCFELGVG
jgi:hypothetical protein